MKREIDLDRKVWGYIDKCLASGLYGDTVGDVVLSLMRDGLAGAIRIGILDFTKQTKRKR